MDRNDPRLIWKAINWRGEINDKDIETPNDEQFGSHFNNLLNLNSDTHPEPIINNAPYIPVLDDPFSLQELDAVIKDMKAGKADMDMDDDSDE